MLFSSTLASLPLAAHDFWLDPSTYQVAEGHRVSISFREGHGEGDPLPRNEKRLERFELHGPNGVMAVPGADGFHPAGVVPAPAPGLNLVGYLNNPARHRLPADRFEAYLAEEGLERTSALRRERGESAEAGVERFYRCAKTLFSVGGRTDGDAWSQSLGLPLELVPQANPFQARPGDTLSLEVLFRGEPLAGALVVAIPRDAKGDGEKGGEGEPVSLRSDEAGLVRLPLSSGGRWRVKVVHMEPAPAGSEVDWESWWASLTFAVPAT